VALIRNSVKKSLATGLIVGLLSLGVSGLSGAAGTSGGSGSAPAAHLDCAGIQAHLARMHHRQDALSAKVQKLTTASTRQANTRKGQRRAGTVRRNLAHWKKAEARIINARFLRREAALTAQAASQCQSATSATPAPSTASA
jgi:hypothetical protein